MLGRTHYKVGLLYYVLISLLTTRLIRPFINIPINLVTLVIVIVAALLADIDEKNSLINIKNPVFNILYHVIDLINALTKGIIAFLLFFIPGVLMIMYGQAFSNNHVLIGMGLIIISFFASKLVYSIPILSFVFNKIDEGSSLLKKFFYSVVFVAAGLGLIYYDLNVINIIWGILFILVAVFPHRTFFHSPEGFLIISHGVKVLLENMGFRYAVPAFVIGYFSHLYLADIFTSTGVPCSCIPYILNKLGIRNKIVLKLMKMRFRIPVMDTGSKLEGVYTAILIVLVLGVYVYS